MPETVSVATILRDEDVLLDSPVKSKSEILAAAADHLAPSSGVTRDVLLKALAGREKLGSTAINQGIAVPHAEIPGLAAPAAVVFRLARPIEFEAFDNTPVDLVFVLVWPSDKRSGLLATLGGLCRILRAETLLQEIRRSSSRAEVRQLLQDSTKPSKPRSDKA